MRGLKLPNHCKRDKRKNWKKKSNPFSLSLRPTIALTKKQHLTRQLVDLTISASQLIHSVKYAREWLFSNPYFFLQGQNFFVPACFTQPLCASFCVTEAATRADLRQKVFLKISQNSHKNTCARVSFLIKLQGKVLPRIYCFFGEKISENKSNTATFHRVFSGIFIALQLIITTELSSSGRTNDLI